MTRPREATDIHTRILRNALAVEESRAYWAHVDPNDPRPRNQAAFEDYWFGAKSMARVEVLVADFRARYDAFPEALEVLRAWRTMSPETRVLVCHWHLQLADPIYRRFTGEYLSGRRAMLRPDVDRDRIATWVMEVEPDRWNTSTAVQFASKLLSAAHAAGLIVGKRDPRPLAWPRVPDEALSYVLYLLRGVEFEGTLTDNPYLRSVGLEGSFLDDRLRGLPALRFQRMGDLVDFGWQSDGLTQWARAWGAA